jgi:hypothetical protein
MEPQGSQNNWGGGQGPMQQQYQQPYAPAPMPGAKSSTTAGLLGIFLGAVGAHDWYLGYKKFGIIHVCLVAGAIVMMVVSGILATSLLDWRSYLDSSVAWKATLAGILSTGGAIVAGGNGIWGLVTGIMCFAKSGMYGHDADGGMLS